eukprot:scaffold283272_cov18-Tisochrysis_lutea.AAC.1
MGNSPEWCTPMPRFSMGRIALTCGSRWSSCKRCGTTTGVACNDAGLLCTLAALQAWHHTCMIQDQEYPGNGAGKGVALGEGHTASSARQFCAQLGRIALICHKHRLSCKHPAHLTQAANGTLQTSFK